MYHVFNVHHSIIDLCFKYTGVQIFAIYFYIPILCKIHFHVTLRCVNDLPNYIQGLFHLKNNSLSNTHTEITLNFFINIMFAEKHFCLT